MITKYNLFLDDVRIPTHVTWVKIPDCQHYTIVRSYQEFVDIIELRGIPQYVCYDHDLSDAHYNSFHGVDEQGGLTIDYSKYREKTGYDCAKWLVNYCMSKNIPHPPYVVHSMNPVGVKNIISYIESYNKSL